MMNEPWASKAITLSNSTINLVPLTVEHAPVMRDAIDKDRLWNMPYGMIPQPAAVEDYIKGALEEQRAGRSNPFAVFAKDGAFLGNTRYRNIEHRRRRLEIGFTWYVRRALNTHVNTDAKLLLLTHAFDTLRCLAVEWRIHKFNHASRAAIERLGAQYDGMLRNYLPTETGAADIAIYSVTDHEWPAVRSHLIARSARLQESKRSASIQRAT